MMAIPKLRFLAIGFLEALGVATGMSAGGTERDLDFPCLFYLKYLFEGVRH